MVERGPWSRYLISAAMPGSLRWFPSSPPSAGRAMIQDATLHWPAFLAEGDLIRQDGHPELS